MRESLTDLIGTLKGRVAVTAFASNVARLDTIARAAKAHGRKVALVGRSMHKMVDAARETGYLKDFPAAASTRPRPPNCRRKGALSRAPAARASRAPRWPASPTTTIPMSASARATR